MPSHQHQEPTPQLLRPHRLVHHLEIDVDEVVTLRPEAVRRPDTGIGQVVQQRSLPDPAIADHRTRFELLIAEPAEDLLHLTRPPEEPAWIRDGITVGKRIALHGPPLQYEMMD